jgi:hypothetical protein
MLGLSPVLTSVTEETHSPRTRNFRNRTRTTMSRRGNCCDDAPTHSFWGQLKPECERRCRFATHQPAQQAFMDCIGFYNHSRLNPSLGYLGPMQLKQGWMAAQHKTAARRSGDAFRFPRATYGQRQTVEPKRIQSGADDTGRSSHWRCNARLASVLSPCICSGGEASLSMPWKFSEQILRLPELG